MKVILRYDGAQESMDGDNLCFTFRSHFIGADGRDYFGSSWIGIANVLRSGVRLDDLQVVS